MLRRVERRAFGRRKTSLRAKAMMPGRAVVYCVIRNLSETGALLDFGDDHVRLPYRFELEIEGFGLKLNCEPRHDTDAGTGVRFLSGDVSEILLELDSTPAMSPQVKEPAVAAPLAFQPASPQPRDRFDVLGFRRARLAVEQGEE